MWAHICKAAPLPLSVLPEHQALSQQLHGCGHLLASTPLQGLHVQTCACCIVLGMIALACPELGNVVPHRQCTWSNYGRVPTSVAAKRYITGVKGRTQN